MSMDFGERFIRVSDFRRRRKARRVTRQAHECRPLAVPQFFHRRLRFKILTAAHCSLLPASALGGGRKRKPSRGMHGFGCRVAACTEAGIERSAKEDPEGRILRGVGFISSIRYRSQGVFPTLLSGFYRRSGRPRRTRRRCSFCSGQRWILQVPYPR